MQILYINSDLIAARTLHAEFLSYRGFVWDLKHCNSTQEAIRLADSTAFDVVMYDSVDDPKRIRRDLENLVLHFQAVPLIALVRGLTPQEELELISLGVHDTIGQRYLDGGYIMRRIRLATTRIAKNAGTPGFVTTSGTDDPDASDAAPVEASGEKQDSTEKRLRPVADTAVKMESIDNPDRKLRLLIVESETAFEDLGNALSNVSEKLDTQKVSSLREGEAILAERIQDFDAVFVEQGVLENEQIHRLKQISQQMTQIPFVMMLVDRSDFSAVSCIEQGFSDCVVGSQTPVKQLLMYTRKAMVRRGKRIQHRIPTAEKNNLPKSDRRARARGSDRRRDARYLSEVAVTAIAVLPDGSPDRDNIYQGISIDFSLTGMGFKLLISDRLPSRNWVVGVSRDTNNQDMVYANVMLRHADYDPDGIRIGAKFKTVDDIFSPSCLAPSIDSQNYRVKYGLPKKILDEWKELNILSRNIQHRAKACPECHALVSIGDGCSQCGSSDIDFKILIHHFACAYVDDAECFQTDAGISCPKCRSSNLIVGADFELIKTQYDCGGCQHQGNQTELVCSCFHCLLRFPLKLAKEVEVYRYHVQRLDILDILDSSK